MTGGTVQVVYAVAADAPAHRSIEKAIPAFIATEQAWLRSQTNGLELRIAARVRFVRLREDAAALAAMGVFAEAAIAAQVPAHSEVIYDGRVVADCGNGLNIAAIYLRGQDTRTGASCWYAGQAGDGPFGSELGADHHTASFWHYVMLHELGHTFGLSHNQDRHDLMYGGPDLTWLDPVRLSPVDLEAFRPWLTQPDAKSVRRR